MDIVTEDYLPAIWLMVNLIIFSLLIFFIIRFIIRLKHKKQEKKIMMFDKKN